MVRRTGVMRSVKWDRGLIRLLPGKNSRSKMRWKILM